MELDAVVGIVLIIGSLGLLTWLVFWSRRTINRVARSRSRSAREIRRELRRDR